jgi:putative transposase
MILPASAESRALSTTDCRGAPVPPPGVWVYFRVPLSFREVEEMMLERGVAVSYETIRRWCATFGQAYANQLRRRRARPGDRWHLDEVFIDINGTQHDR